MKPGRVAADGSPSSTFVREMKAAFNRRALACTVAEKRAVEREYEGIMRKHLGRSAWDAAQAFDVADVRVPRDTTRDRTCHTTGVASEAHEAGEVDRKLAAAGRDVD